MNRRLITASAVAGALVVLVAGPAAAATWTTVPAPSVGTQSGLAAVDLLSGSDGWAVGFTASTGGLTEHWNGTSFSVVPSPNIIDPSVTSNGASLTGVDALTSTSAFAVGSFRFSGSDGLQHSDAVAERWNGSVWARMTVPNNSRINTFNDVKAFSASDVWAVGRAGDTISGLTLAMHWNGTTWAPVSTPSPGTRDNFLLAVSGSASNDVWAVGYYFDQPYGNRVRHSLALHWNGTAWSRVTAPDVGPIQTFLRDVVAVSATNAWAVGFAIGTGVNTPVVLHWNGSAWSVASAPSALGQLTSVTALSASDIWAAGLSNSDSLGRLANWRGSSWTVSTAPSSGSLTSVNLLGITTTAPSTVISVGQASNPSTGATSPVAVRTATG